MRPVAPGVERHVEISREQVGQFLVIHARRTIICYNAAALHWTLHGLLGGNTDALAALWGLSRNWQLRDVMLLDQRLRLADKGLHCLLRKLDALACDYCRPELHNTSGPSARLQALHAVYGAIHSRVIELIDQWEPLPPWPPVCPEQADHAWAVRDQQPITRSVGDSPNEFHARRSRMFAEIHAEVEERCQNPGKVDPSRVLAERYARRRRKALRRALCRFGPLGVGLDVQGAIAAESAKRAGITLDGEQIADLRQACDKRYRRSCGVLHEHPPSRACFHWQDGNRPLVKKDRGGHPQSTKRLRDRLAELLDVCRDIHGSRLITPRDEQGRISVLPRHWGFIVRCHPELRAWADIVAAAAVQRSLARYRDDTRRVEVKPGYSVVPHIDSFSPCLEEEECNKINIFV